VKGVVPTDRYAAATPIQDSRCAARTTGSLELSAGPVDPGRRFFLRSSTGLVGQFAPQRCFRRAFPKHCRTSECRAFPGFRRDEGAAPTGAEAVQGGPNAARPAGPGASRFRRASLPLRPPCELTRCLYSMVSSIGGSCFDGRRTQRSPMKRCSRFWTILGRCASSFPSLPWFGLSGRFADRPDGRRGLPWQSHSPHFVPTR
jgi:hypothetical protein